MALVWLLLAPSCGAKVIESSRVKGGQPVQFPFEIAAYFLPDKDLARLAEDVPSAHPAFADILGNSRVIREDIARAQHVAPRNVTVLIEGEWGYIFEYASFCNVWMAGRLPHRKDKQSQHDNGNALEEQMS
jgi:Transcriptional regulator containing PAS, AAA-type ATPase, and DNA-binding domains